MTLPAGSLCQGDAFPSQQRVSHHRGVLSCPGHLLSPGSLCSIFKICTNFTELSVGDSLLVLPHELREDGKCRGPYLIPRKVPGTY